MAVAVQKIRNAVAADRLAELVAIIGDEHGQVDKHTRLTLEHAFRCGDALLEAHELVPHGKWNPWLVENVATYGITLTTARAYMRLSRNQHLLADYTTESVYGAIRILRVLPEVVGGKGMYQRRKHFQGDPDEARRLYEDGLNYREVGEHLGVSASTAYYYIHPARRDLTVANARKTRSRVKQAEARIKQNELDAAARRLNGGISEAYSALRKLVQSMDVLWRDGATPEIRAASGEVLKNLHAAEDAFNTVLKANLFSSQTISRKRGPVARQPKKESVS